MTAEYTLKKENGSYTILVNGSPMLTHKGTPVTTTSEKLAQRLVDDAVKFDGDYARADSVLCYHFTTIENTKLDDETLHMGFAEHCSEVLRSDPYLMFRQCGERMAVENVFLKSVPYEVDELPIHKRAAFIVMMSAFNSVMLPHYIVTDLINENMRGLEPFKEGFIDQLELLELDDFEHYAPFDREELSAAIDAFIFYYSLESV